MNNFNRFIDKYKELEKICRANGKEVSKMEEELDEVSSDRLRMCRYFRNFIQHSKGYEKFLSITEYMQKFLDKLVEEENMKQDVVKKHLIKTVSASCDIRDKTTDILDKFAKVKLDKILVFDKQSFLGLISVYDILSLDKGKKLKDVKKFNKEYHFVEPGNLMSEIDKDDYLICKDGEKILGVVKK